MRNLSRRALQLAAPTILVSTIACGFLPISRTSRAGVAALESLPKPPPVDSTFHDCGPAGSQPDYVINRLKNRIDTAPYLPVQWTLIARLPWPRRVGYRFRNQWTEGERTEVARYEGVPVQVDGYLADYKLEIPEPPNCFATAPSEKDYHVWLADGPTQGKRQSVVVELTPRVRVNHPGWAEDRLAALREQKAPVRISGWLMLDQMHPENVGRNRITLWEVHPVMRIEWQSKTRGWVSLDSISPVKDSVP